MESAASRLRTALELFEVGEQMMRARLAREHPEWDASQIDAAIHRWLRDRPGAEHGDHPGGPSKRTLGRAQ